MLHLLPYLANFYKNDIRCGMLGQLIKMSYLVPFLASFYKNDIPCSTLGQLL